MNLILTLWHDLCADWSQDELDLRAKDFSASDVWAARVAVHILWHRAEAMRLRETSWLWRAVNQRRK